MSTQLVWKYLSGMNRTETDSRGTLFHAMIDPSEFGTAICGQKPGRRSNGWFEPPIGVQPSRKCPRCESRVQSGKYHKRSYPQGA